MRSISNSLITEIFGASSRIRCILLFTSTVAMLQQIGVVDAELGARSRRGISIYICLPFSAFHLWAGVLVWAFCTSLIYWKALSDAYRERRSLKTLRTLALLIFAVFGVQMQYQIWFWLRRRAIPFATLPKPSSQVLVFDAGVGRMANAMINFLWLTIRSNRTGKEIRVINDVSGGVLADFPNVR
jgi:hypothetical protein